MMRTVVSLWLCVLASGCGISAAPISPFGGPDGTVVWDSPVNTKEPVPGIDRGAVHAVGKAFIVWGDHSRGAGGSSHSIGSQGVEGSGYLETDGGGKCEFRYATKDGKTGRVTLDDVDFDLANGNVFLVAAEGNRFRVKQLRRDLGWMKLAPEFFQSFARNDRDIRAFFAGADGTE